jgi:putative tryptophan/tyrosine transport system substrate-binding protein
MRRREVIALVGGAAALPLAGRAQSVKSHRVGALAGGFPPRPGDPIWAAFTEGFRELGYVEGRNLVLEGRFAAGNLERLPALARELAALKVEAIVVFGPAPMRAAQAATRDIPIVMAAGSSDPVAEGYIASFARPGGNITGLTYAVSAERFGKQLELLKEAVGALLRVAMLWDGDLELFRRSWEPALEQAAGQLDLEFEGPFLVRAPEEFERAFAQMVDRRVQGVLVASSAIITQSREKLAEVAARHRMPVIAAFREFPATGSLMSYGPNLPSIYRRAAAFVDKILTGTPPGEIPVEQPIRYDFAINLKTARTLGLTIPPTLLARADEVIE